MGFEIGFRFTDWSKRFLPLSKSTISIFFFFFDYLECSKFCLKLLLNADISLFSKIWNLNIIWDNCRWPLYWNFFEQCLLMGMKWSASSLLRVILLGEVLGIQVWSLVHPFLSLMVSFHEDDSVYWKRSMFGLFHRSNNRIQKLPDMECLISWGFCYCLYHFVKYNFLLFDTILNYLHSSV